MASTDCRCLAFFKTIRNYLGLVVVVLIEIRFFFSPRPFLMCFFNFTAQVDCTKEHLISSGTQMAHLPNVSVVQNVVITWSGIPYYFGLSGVIGFLPSDHK